MPQSTKEFRKNLQGILATENVAGISEKCQKFLNIKTYLENVFNKNDRLKMSLKVTKAIAQHLGCLPYIQLTYV